MNAELLKRSPLFKDFTPVGLEIFARIATPRIVLSGQTLFAEGADGEGLCIVVEGRFRVVVRDSAGRDLALGSLEPGEHMGEMALLSLGKPLAHMCSVVSEVDSKVLEIKQADFLKTMAVKPQACVKLIMSLAQGFGRKVFDSQDTLRHLLTKAAGR